MCRLCGGNVKLLECVFFFRGSLSIVSRFFIDGMCVVAFAHATNTMSGTTFHSPCDNVIDERLVFCGFPMQGSAVNISLQYVNLSAQSHHPYLRPSPDGSFRTNTRVSSS